MFVSKLSDNLDFISFAALFVNVTANIEKGEKLLSSISHKILWIKTLVLPLPAPAMTKLFRDKLQTASLCASLRLSKV